MFESTHNTLDPRVLQVHSLNPFIRSISASRADMFASEIGQAPPLKGAEVRRIMSGMEREFGKYTQMVKIPEDCTIFRVIHKRTPLGVLGQTIVTSTTVIYRTIDGIFNTVNIPVHSQNHQQFGFDYVRTDAAKSMQPGKWLAKDTILACSPSLDSAGNYKYGVNAKLALMSIPEIGQDGVVISETLAEKAQFRGYTTVTLSFGNDTIPLNLFGDDHNYKIMPDVGEPVLKNGLIFASRELKEGCSVTQMNRYALRTEEEFDSRTFTPKRGARVIDIEVIHNRTNKPTLPTMMDEQCKRYWRCSKDYYNDVRNAYNEIRKEVGAHNVDNVIGEHLHTLLVRAEAMLYEPAKGAGTSVTFLNNDSPLNEWTVHVTVGYDLYPTASFKLAGDSGNKGVTVVVWKDEWMPIDKSGVRAEIIMDGGSTVNRLNPAGIFEQFINASAHATHQRIIKMVNEGQTTAALDYLLRFYKIITPRYHAAVVKRGAGEHLKYVLEGGIYLVCPTDNPVYYPDVVKTLMEEYPPCLDTVKYRSGEGVWTETKRPVLIGDQYFIFLEKIGDDYSAVSSPVLQPQGIPGKISRGDKYASPGRPQAIRGLGETEDRIVAANTDPLVPVDMLSTTNSPVTHKRQVRAYLTHPTPTRIQDVLRHDTFKRSGNKITSGIANSLLAAGFRFEERTVED